MTAVLIILAFFVIAELIIIGGLQTGAALARYAYRRLTGKL